MEPSSKSTSTYIYKYYTVSFQSGLDGLVIKPAVWAISLCWLGRLFLAGD